MSSPFFCSIIIAYYPFSIHMKSSCINITAWMLVILIFLYASCNSNENEIIEYAPSGNIYKKYYIDQDSLLSGPYFTYYEDGRSLFERASYKNGKLSGKRVLYYPSGQPEIIESYIDDILIDTLYVFYESGSIKRKAPYTNGVLTGVLLVFYENGQLKEEVTFEENRENGKFVEYHENGQIKWTGQYLNGENEFGLLTEYNDRGEAIKKMNCDSLAICRTIWKIDQEDS